MSFINDDSAQLGINSVTYNPTYSSVSDPNITFNDLTSGIYNPSDNTIVLYTASTPALTIDSSQILTGNGGGLTNLQYSNVNGKPATFPADYNNIINKPSIITTSFNFSEYDSLE